VVRELVTLHGGRTRAEGAPSGGARVVIELPLTQPDSNEPPNEQTGHNMQLKAVP
jgi:signal transduction histidine kinase